LCANVELPPAELEAEARGVSVNEILRERARFAAERNEALRKFEIGELTPQTFPRRFNIIRNQDCGWQEPVPIKEVNTLGDKPARSFRAFLPLDDLGKIPTPNWDETFDRLWEGKWPKVSCLLADSWRFDEIDISAQKRIGHEYNGRRHDSIQALIVKGVYDLEDGLLVYHPKITALASADFFGSWQVWKHVAVFCDRVGKSQIGKELAGHSWDAREQAEQARDFIFKELVAYAHEIASLTVAASADKPSVTQLESIGVQLNRLRQESRLTLEQLAEEVKLDRRNVSRHLSDFSVPHLKNLGAYERVLSKHLERKVVIDRTPLKRP